MGMVRGWVEDPIPDALGISFCKGIACARAVLLLASADTGGGGGGGGAMTCGQPVDGCGAGALGGGGTVCVAVPAEVG